MERPNLRKIAARFRTTQPNPSKPHAHTTPADKAYKTRKRWSLAIVLAVLALMVLTATANMSQRMNQAVLGYSAGNRAPDAVPPAPQSMGEANPKMMSATPAMGSSTSGRDTSSTSGSASQQSAPDWDRMIIRTATLQLQVKDVAATLDEVRGLAGAHAGYVATTDSHAEGEYTVATITLQVPAREFDNVIGKLRKVGIKVTGENVSSSDVTEEYTDLQSQLRNLQATEQRMTALMQKAERIEDVLTLDRELRQIQGEIEKAQGRINYLGKRSEMSTITVSLYPEAAPISTTAKPAEGWDPVQIAQKAWNSSLELLSGLANVIITVAVFMWWAIPLLALAAWLARRPSRRSIESATPNAEA